jgi:hypothetical protein
MSFEKKSVIDIVHEAQRLAPTLCESSTVASTLHSLPMGR